MYWSSTHKEKIMTEAYAMGADDYWHGFKNCPFTDPQDIEDYNSGYEEASNYDESVERS
jgi:hypothetical protein